MESLNQFHRKSFRMNVGKLGMLGVLVAIVSGLILPLLHAQNSSKLHANPARDLYEASLLTHQTASETRDRKLATLQFAAAARQFNRYLQHYPDTSNTDSAWYHLGSSLQQAGDEKSAQQCFQTLVTQAPDGRIRSLAAFQIATADYNRKNYAQAEKSYRLAASRFVAKEVRQVSEFRRAICFQNLKKTSEFIVTLTPIASDNTSPYQLPAVRSLAFALRDQGKTAHALRQFENLLNKGNASLRDESLLQAAFLSQKLKKSKKATTYYEQILRRPSLKKWWGLSQLSIMGMHFTANNHPAVIKTYNLGTFPLEKKYQINRLNLAAKSYEALGQPDKALSLFAQLAKIDPNSESSFQAAYRVLTSRYGKSHPRFEVEARSFLTRHTKGHTDHSYLHNTRLMLAETLYQRKAFREAAKEYQRIDLKKINRPNHAGIRYKTAVALNQSKQPKSSLAAWQSFFKHHPKDRRRAAALHQCARIYQRQKNYPQTFATHQKILSEFPNRSAEDRAESKFWSGWALFGQKKYRDSVSHFESARTLSPKELEDDSTRHLVLAHYALQDADSLMPELNRLSPEAYKKIPLSLYAWLGVKMNQAGRHNKAYTYFDLSINFQNPSKTKPFVWRAFATSAQETDHLRPALHAVNHLIEVEENAWKKAELYYQKSSLALSLKDADLALQAAEEGLNLKPVGTLNGKLRTLLGDIAFAKGNHQEASQHYVVVIELFSEDEALKKSALKKAIATFKKMGDPQSLDKAQKYHKILETMPLAPTS